METVHNFLVLVLIPAVVAAALGALAKLLASKGASDLVNSLSVRAAAETEHLIAKADESNNALLAAAVHAAMSYAEMHKDEVLKQFDSKAEYVIHSVLSSPKFAAFQGDAEDIKNLIEQFYLGYFVNLETPVKNTAVKPMDDVPGGGPGKP
jgi:hypothetical protein